MIKLSWIIFIFSIGILVGIIILTGIAGYRCCGIKGTIFAPLFAIIFMILEGYFILRYCIRETN